VRRVEERRVARSKTLLLAGASVAGFLITYAAFGPARPVRNPMGTGAGRARADGERPAPGGVFETGFKR